MTPDVGRGTIYGMQEVSLLARAVLSCIVVYAALLFVVSFFGMLGAVELVLLFVASVALTALFIRWDRQRARRAEGTTSG